MAAACALAIFSGKIIYKFGIPERLRTLRYSIFTGGVVEENGICSACFLRKRRRCGGGLSLPLAGKPSQSSLRDASSPEGGALFVLTGRWKKAPPSGELARERLRGFASDKQLFLQFMELAQVFSFCGLTASPGIRIL